MKRRTFLGMLGLAAVAPKAVAMITERTAESGGVALHDHEKWIPSDMADRIRAVAFDGPQLVAIGTAKINGEVFYSSDGFTWTTRRA